ncbi:MAG: alpha/beta hydrolase [Phycisphaerales bacterium]
MNWVLLLLAVVLFGAVLRAGRVIESAAFFAPSRAAFGTPVDIDDLTLPGPNDSELHAWRLRALTDAPRGLVLFLHGNAGNLPDHLFFVDRLPRMGYEVVIVDYRGFGRSSDLTRVHRETLMADARAAAEALEAMHPDRPLLLIGHSMGGVMAMNLAAEHPGRFAAVAAVAPFASFPRVAGDFAGVLGPMLIRGGLAAEDAAERLATTRLLLVHGDADQIVRPYHSERIHQRAVAAGVDVRLVVLPGADHVDLFDPPHDAQRLIAEFFTQPD